MKPTLEKVVSIGEIESWVPGWRRENPGCQVVATNGCFDILHIGHTRYLHKSRQLGDLLIVGVNSDESVRDLKGPGRPKTPELERAEIIASLEAVGCVCIFPQRSALEFLRLVSPDIYTKGGDYTLETMDQDERQLLESIDCEIRFISEVPNHSTTQVIAGMAANKDMPETVKSGGN